MPNPLETLAHSLAQQLLPAYSEAHVAEHNAWFLLEHLTHKSRAALIAHPELQLTPEQENQLQTWVNDIVQDNKPIQYILGTVPFLDLTIKVRPPTLIPRPETEEWCATLIERLRSYGSIRFSTHQDADEKHSPRAGLQKLQTNKSKNTEAARGECSPQVNVSNHSSGHQFTILDLCTGSGCIALALAHAFPKSTVYASDISPEALALAQDNARLNNITNVTFIHSDLFNAIPHQRFNLIIANPPYITPEEYNSLDASVSQWEDKKALVADENGLKIIHEIIKKAPPFLQKTEYPFPQVWIEIGYHQGASVSDLFKKYGFEPHILQDLYGNDRVVTGTLLEAF
jgi:release factor glutamine methyltransferase